MSRTRVLALVILLALKAAAWSEPAELDLKWQRVDRLVAEGRYAEAAPIAEQVVALAKEKRGTNHKDYRDALRNLGQIYFAMGRADRFSAINSELKGLPPLPEVKVDPESFEAIMSELEDLVGFGQFEQGLPLAEKLVQIAEQRFAGTDKLGEALHNLGWLQVRLGRSDQAVEPLRKAYALRVGLLGKEHVYTLRTGMWFGAALVEAGKLDEAATIYEAVIPAREREVGPDDADLRRARQALAQIYVQRRDWSLALATVRKVTSAYRQDVNRRARDTSLTAQAALARASNTVAQFRSYALLELWLTSMTGGSGPEAISDAFAAAQVGPGAGAGDALEGVGTKFGPRSNSKLNELVHLRARLERERSSIYDSGRMLQMSQRLDELDEQIAAAAKAVVDADPKYAALSTSDPVAISDVRRMLARDEVLILIVDVPSQFGLPGSVFLWVVAGEGEPSWFRVDLSTEKLNEYVTALRCGLDATLWVDASKWPAGSVDEAAREQLMTRRRTCGDLLKVEPAIETVDVDGEKVETEVLPFDVKRAHDLYRILFGQIEQTLVGKKLLVVQSGPLSSLPLHVLVTEQPAAPQPLKLAAYRNISWLGQRNAITTLPTVSSLKALRCYATVSHAAKPYLGIGNPLLDGPKLSPWKSDLEMRARKAREKVCEVEGPRQSAAPRDSAVSRARKVDAAAITELEPLPETADEVCAIAKLQQGSNVVIGTEATKATLRRMSDVATIGARSELADYKVIHFATHGVLPGQVNGVEDGGLILTPGRDSSRDRGAPAGGDNGFLSSAEIASLGLDADLVVLSACNTAGGAREGADALSGLARAFFNAGARALLVTHWEVDSDATVALMTKTFELLAQNPSLGRSEALRLSMRQLMEKGRLVDAHPANWAPFVVVGEGAHYSSETARCTAK